MLHFQNIEYFIAVLAVPVLVYLFYALIKWKKNVAARIGDPHLVKALTDNYSPKKFTLKFILFTGAFVLCIVALAGLVKPDDDHKIERKGTDIVITLDVSRSMLASDIKPNRLERAKQLIYKVIENSPNDRIGLVIFAGRAYLQMPLTLDHAAAKMYVASTSPDDVPTQGTVLHYALQMSANAFSLNDKTFKSILLISDGEDHDPNAIKEAAKLAKQGIVVNTVGIGSVSGAPILDERTGQYKLDNEGNTVISKLNEQELMKIAEAGGGMYQLFSNPATMAKALRKKLDNMGSESVISDASFSSFIQYFQYFLSAALLLLLLEFFTPEKRKKVVNGLMVFVMLLGFNTHAVAQNKDKIVEGNRAYIENRFEEAERSYREALKNDEGNEKASYNLGNSLYRQNKTEDAVKAFDEVIAGTQDLELKQKAFYNKGVTLQKANELEKSIVAYKNALILNPDDEEARQNLQRALKQKQQQQQQQNQQNKQDQKEEQKQNKQQQNQEKEEQRKQQQSKLSREEAEEKLKALMEKERNLQEKLKKVKGIAPENPEKDW